MNEKEKILTFGKIKVNVADVSHSREQKAVKMWNELLKLGLKKTLTETYYNKMVNKIGAYLIRQDFSILMRRHSLAGAVRQYIKRLMITPFWINKAIKEDYTAFHDWVSVTITGKTIDELQKKKKMQEFTMEMYETITLMGYTPETLINALEISQAETAGKSNISKAGQQDK